ncbi:hypothetical protein CCS79_09185 [Clostridium diolis]|uniref:DUF5050 domain-containing protein n=1 Tax=Clostridium diolis TaxID=223919 RepID=UPI000B403914|nr:DUF5050 domain-containing protein [Clostridium diolis]OVE69087.1 hypothetical protein CCS79_09185 [Clostridium diolis]
MKRLKLKKVISSSLLVVLVFVLNPMGVNAEWKQDSNGWWNAEGNSWSVGWKEIDGKWYYFGQDGYMKMGWIQYEDKWYYLGDDGAMLKNTTINGYKLDSDGVLIQSSQNDSSDIHSQKNDSSNVESKDKNVSDETEVSNRKPIIKDGNYLYESGKLSKVNIDGTNKTYFEQSYGSIIGVSDGWVYYVDETTEHPVSKGIYKIKDNEKVKLTSEDYIVDAVLYKGSIYYALGPEMVENNVVKGGLYKVDIDGTNKVQLSDQLVENINIYKDCIYYSGSSSVTTDNTITSENSGIFKMNTDGSNRIKISDRLASFLKLSGENIYFSNRDDGGKLYKISINGTDEKKLNDDISWDIQVDGNWVYYSNNPYDGHTDMILPLDKMRGNIYKITIDGMDRTKINSEASRLSEVLDGWIYYNNWSDDKLYKMKLDGSNKSVVEY